MSVTFKDNRAAFDRLNEEITKHNDIYVKVGVQSGTKHTEEDGGNVDLVLIAAANEFGTSTIPSRPFLRSTFDAYRDNINKLTDVAYESVQKGESTLARGLDRIGFWFASKVQKAIRDWKTPPNALSTQRIKGAKVGDGVLVDNPLVDTGQLQQSIRHVVVEGN